MFCFKHISFIFKISSFFILFSISLSGVAVHSADVILTWNRPNDARVTGYKIYYGLKDTNFKSVPEKIINSPGQTSCNIYDLRHGDTYGFAAKSFDKLNHESVFSKEISYDVPEVQDKNSNGNNVSNDDIDDDSEKNIDSNSNNANNDDASDDNAGASSGGGGCFFQTISVISQ